MKRSLILSHHTLRRAAADAARARVEKCKFDIDKEQNGIRRSVELMQVFGQTSNLNGSQEAHPRRKAPRA